MAHPIHRVVQFEIVAPYTLRVMFDDGSEQTVDLTHVLVGEVFGPLMDEALFNGASLDHAAGTIVWPNGADFDPATLHDWPDVKDELVARARTWVSALSDRAR